MDNEIENKIIASKAKEIEIRITMDKTIFEKVRVLEAQMQVGKSVSYEEVKTFGTRCKWLLSSLAENKQGK